MYHGVQQIWLTLVTVSLVSVPLLGGSQSKASHLGYFQIKLLSVNLQAVPSLHPTFDALGEGDNPAASTCGDQTLLLTACLSHHQLPLPRAVECTLGSNQTQLALPLDDVWLQKMEEDFLIPFSFSWPRTNLSTSQSILTLTADNVRNSTYHFIPKGSYTLALTAKRKCLDDPEKDHVVSQMTMADHISPLPHWTVILSQRTGDPGEHKHRDHRGSRSSDGVVVKAKRHVMVTSSLHTSFIPSTNVQIDVPTRPPPVISSRVPPSIVPTSDTNQSLSLLQHSKISINYTSFVELRHTFHREKPISPEPVSISPSVRLSISKPHHHHFNKKVITKRGTKDVSYTESHLIATLPMQQPESNGDSPDTGDLKLDADDENGKENRMEEMDDVEDNELDDDMEKDEDNNGDYEEEEEDDLVLSSQAVVRFVGASIIVAVRVKCSRNYYGSSCTELCRPRDDLHGHYSCDEKGQRVCLAGWTGLDCTQAVCSERCRGVCSLPGVCTCRHGWFGEHCDKCRTASGCAHGECHLPGQCKCHRGWAGPLCDVERKYCLDHRPCLNGGTCHPDLSHNYTCQCPLGFTGAHCEVNECHQHFCMHSGTCQIAAGTRFCHCPPQFTGPRCQHKLHTVHSSSSAACPDPPCTSLLRSPGDTEQDTGNHDCRGQRCDTVVGRLTSPCLHHVCLNGGSCVEVLSQSAPICRCPPPFGGEHCSLVKDPPCEVNPCLNGGRCRRDSRKGEAFSCQCNSGFSGKLCQKRNGGKKGTTLCGNGILASRVISCLNGGRCEASKRSGQYYCACPENFRGEFCEQKVVDRCWKHLCWNGGVCSFTGNGSKPVCVCPAGRTGERCEFRLDLSPCHSAPCLNGATCVELPQGGYQCQCWGHYEGRLCERKKRHEALIIEIRSDCCFASAATAPSLHVMWAVLCSCAFYYLTLTLT